MQQVCNNFLADPTDTSFGFQIKCKNCQFTRKQHIQNNNVKPNPQSNKDNIVQKNPEQKSKLIDIVVDIASQNPKNQVSMSGSLNQQKEISPTTSKEQSEFKKTTSLNSKLDEKNETDLLANNQIKLERQNLQIYNSDKTSINQNTQDQEQTIQANESNKDKNTKESNINPSIQQNQTCPQKMEQIQNQNEITQNEPEIQKPNKLQSNMFIQQNQHSPQKLEQKVNTPQPFQIKPQVQISKDQKEQQSQLQTQNEQTTKPSGNLLIPQSNQNTNQSVKERAKSMQVFGFGAPPPIKISQKTDQEMPLESYLIDRPILQNKKHNRTKQEFQDIQK